MTSEASTLRELFRKGPQTPDARATPRNGSDSLPPFVPWGIFPRVMQWRQGEHVTLIGQTGSGKTTLALDLLNRRRFVVVLATKPRDRTFSDLKAKGYHVARSWPVPTEVHERVVYWPKIDAMRDTRSQRRAIAGCLESIYESGGWTVYADELRYLADPAYLGLRTHLQLLWQQGRAMDITVVGANQRPAWIPLEAYSQASHLFFWNESDESNLKKVASIAGLKRDVLKDVVPRLPRHEALYVRPRDGYLARTKLPANAV